MWWDTIAVGAPRIAWRWTSLRIKSITVMDIVPTHLLLDDLTADVARAYYHWFFLAQPAPLPKR